MRTLTMSAVSVSTAAVLVTAGIATAGGAHAASTDGPDYEMPFPCADTWDGKQP